MWIKINRFSKTDHFRAKRIRMCGASGFGLFALARQGQYSACGGMDPDARGLFAYVKRFPPARVLGS
jgi:hypothetical protein